MAERALTQRIASTIGGLISDEKLLQAEIESSSVQLKLLAEAMEKEGKTDQPTNFEEILRSQVGELAAAQPCPEDHHILQAFRETIRGLRQGGEGGGDDEDDELVMTSHMIVKNTNCPITMRPVEDLTDPVCCVDCRHVYEKSAILDMIRRDSKCPVPGCHRRLRPDRLACDTELMMAIRELRARKATATAEPEEIDEL